MYTAVSKAYTTLNDPVEQALILVGLLRITILIVTIKIGLFHCIVTLIFTTTRAFISFHLVADIGTSSNQWGDGKNPTDDPDECSRNFIHNNIINTFVSY